MILAIDPGNIESAFVVWNGANNARMGKIPNADMLAVVREWPGPVAVEMIASYGMPVGREVFDTCVWIGRFLQIAGESRTRLVYRREVKMHHCGSAKAKDSNIIQALKDKYGDKGTKKDPGTTYGLAGDTWQAFALATFITETTNSAAPLGREETPPQAKESNSGNYNNENRFVCKDGSTHSGAGGSVRAGRPK